MRQSQKIEKNCSNTPMIANLLQRATRQNFNQNLDFLYYFKQEKRIFDSFQRPKLHIK